MPINPALRIGEPNSATFLGTKSRESITKRGDPPSMYLSMLSQIRPEIIASCHAAIDDAKGFAEKWLSLYMLKKDPAHAKKVAEWLSDGSTYKSHGKVIDYVEAKNTLKLNIDPINPDTELWYSIWELYVRSIHYLHASPNAAKLYESNHASLMMTIKISQITQNQASA